MPEIRPIGVSGSIPSVNQLALGDIALNTYDGKAYLKKLVGPTQTIIEIGATASLLRGSADFIPIADPDPTGANLTDTFLFVSSSNTTLGYDLYFRQDGNLVKWKWLEGQLGTGLLYGGALSATGSTLYVSSGSGIIVNYSASLNKEVNPIIQYVNWAPISASALYISASTQTYVSINSAGTLQQQTTFFTPEQYLNSIPLGVFYHADRASIRATGGDAATTYATSAQSFAFIRAFGPLKLSGLNLAPQSGSLRASTSAGTAFVLGGFYQNNYNNPSTYNVPAYATSSFSRWYKSGSSFVADTNAGAFYTTIDPTKYDNGSGTLASVPGGSFTIQRVFINPTAARGAVYYGSTTYNTLSDALAAVTTDPFVEADLTAHNNVFSAYIVVKGNATDLTNPNDARIIEAGLYRSVAGGGTGAIVSLALDDLTDVTITAPVDGQALIYSSSLWINGNPTSASFANTASYSIAALSSSYAISASFANSALSSITATSASFASTASYVNPLTQNVSITGNLIVRGTASVDVLITTYESSSIIYSSGSTKFGDSLDDFHQFTGSLLVTGSSHSIIGPTTINNLTGSLFGTASWAQNALAANTASFAFSSSLVYINDRSTTDINYPLIFKGDSFSLDDYRSLGADTAGPYYNPLKNTLGSVAGLIVSASSFSGPLTGSLLGTASYAENAKVFPFTGSAIISGSLTVEGNVTVNSATTIDLNTSVLNINAPTIQVPSFGLPYSPSAAVRTVMYDAVSNILFVTASIPGTTISFITTGSVTALVDVGPAASKPYFFLVQSGSVDMLSINANRTLTLETRYDTPPATTGSIFYSASGDFFLGTL